MLPAHNSIINFELYKIFYHAAHSLNFSKTAETLHVTQSAISQAIKSLETQLDVALFYRQGRTITLTYEGEVLFQHVEKAFNFILSAEHSLQNIKSLEEGTIFIGASDTITRYLLMDVIKTFHADFPKVKIAINNRPSPRSADKLRKGELDLAVINILPNSQYEGLHMETLLSLEHVFVHTEPPKKKKSHLSDMANFPLICLEQQSTTRKIMEQFYEMHQVALVPNFEFGSYDVILEAIQAQMGVGFVPKAIVEKQLDQSILYEQPLYEKIPSIEVALLLNQEKPLSLAASKFIDILRAHFGVQN